MGALNKHISLYASFSDLIFMATLRPWLECPALELSCGINAWPSSLLNGALSREKLEVGKKKTPNPHTLCYIHYMNLQLNNKSRQRNKIKQPFPSAILQTQNGKLNKPDVGSSGSVLIMLSDHTYCKR